MEAEQELPGFRFHPTEEELLGFYLSRVAHGKKLQFDIIGTLNIYRHDPWDLPGMAKIGEREWYFFVPRDRNARNGGRPNRTTERGFWKATGSDRAIRSTGDPKRVIGLKKTLVFYQGRAPRGNKTDWIMNEYRLPEYCTGTAPPKEDMVLCKIYRKATSLKELEQRAAMEEVQRPSNRDGTCMASQAPGASIGDDDLSSEDRANALLPSSSSVPSDSSSDVKAEAGQIASTSVRQEPDLPQLQLPAQSHGALEWLQDPFLAQLCSPLQEQLCWSPYANLLYF